MNTDSIFIRLLLTKQNGYKRIICSIYRCNPATSTSVLQHGLRMSSLNHKSCSKILISGLLRFNFTRCLLLKWNNFLYTVVRSLYTRTGLNLFEKFIGRTYVNPIYHYV